MNLTIIHRSKVRVYRAKNCAAVLALALAGSLLAGAQEPDGFSQVNGSLDTNGVMHAEDLSRLINDLMPPDDPGAENGAAPEGAAVPPGRDGAGSGSSSNRPSSSDPKRERSGRDSRSQRYSRERASQSNRSAGGSASASSGSAEAGANKSPASLDYPAFKLVAERNIFNPNRSPRRSQEPSVRPREKDPEYFTLVGTMSYEKGTFAFFNGSSSSYQKALKAADTIAGYKLTAITPDAVKLARETNQVELAVGMQMRRDEEGGWRPAKASTYAASGATTSGPANTPGSATNPQAGATSSGAESDVIKRMMQRREKE